jgi:PAS domain S-box-containing protein
MNPGQSALPTIQTITKESSPEAVLQCIVDLAREVVPARYAALAITGESGRIEQFLSSGMSPSEQERIGHPPEGYGLLGHLPRARGPLLVPDVAADPRATGFPVGHPQLHSLLGVPLRLGERLLGSLYLSERWDAEPFTEADAATVELFAAQAAATIDRALAFDIVGDEDVAAVTVLKTYVASTIDRSMAYQRVEEQRDQLRIILDSLPAGVLIVSGPDGRIEMTNRAMTGMLFGPTAALGRLPAHCRDVEVLRADGSPLPRADELSGRALDGQEIRNQQLLLETAQGKQMPVLVQATPLPDACGEVTGAVLVFQDITRLREAEQLKDDFLSLVSHEFRTPLTTIHGGAHLLMNQGEQLDPETRRELLHDIVEESDRLDRMLANMLLLTEVLAGRLEARLEPLPVEQLVRAAATSAAARTGNHTFHIDFAPGLLPARGDSALLAQVLSNLYQNAVKYSPKGGKILTKVAFDGHLLTITISDQGIGIREAEIERVFDRFYRAGGNPNVHGTGLGLYLSRHLVEVQGGRISASSPGLGRGAAFTVTLPVDPDSKPTAAEDVAAPADTE